MGTKTIRNQQLNVLQRARLAISNRMIAWAGVFGVGLMPCPDCGLPLGVKIWPVAGVVWLFHRVRRRSARTLDLLIMEDVNRPPEPES